MLETSNLGSCYITQLRDEKIFPKTRGLEENESFL